ncbi:MAG: GntR family transcriptional regulator [Candidatus Aminicenantes bacterium]|nr:GntR family transcriptional regulator [Candidatus Aminicenantes bacterium]
MKQEGIINIKSLKEQVYDYLRKEIHRHNLRAGSAINMDATSQKLGISKTPLRDALIQLEMEGFVTIAPRRGIFVNPLTLEDIKNYYQVIGALESSALINSFKKIGQAEIKKMYRLNKEMGTAIEKENFDLFYEKNLEFHNCYIHLCGNNQLIKIVTTLKKRLYDFPQQEKWIKEWELSSILEHRKIVELIAAGKAREAAGAIHDIHWSFDVQEKFIMKYYSPRGIVDNS